MRPITCECGNEKDIVHGVACCGHCDQPCPKMPGTCAFCLTYSARTNNRASVEYANEKRRNGR